MTKARCVFGFLVALLCWTGGAHAQDDPVPLLIDKLQNSDSFRVRTQAAAVLGRLRDQRSVEPLIDSLLGDESYAVRGASAGALGNIGDSRCIGPLFKALLDSDGFVQSLAEKSLLGLEGPGLAAGYRVHLLEDSGKPREIALMRLTALARAGDADAVAVFLEALINPELHDRAEAVIGSLPANVAVPALIPALTADDAEVRSAAARTLSRHGSPEVVAALVNAYNATGEEESVKSEVRKALVAMRAFVNVEEMAQLAQSGEISSDRSRAIRLLGVMADGASVAALTACLDDIDPFIQGKAALALGDANAKGALPKLEQMRAATQDDRMRGILDAAIKQLK